MSTDPLLPEKIGHYRVIRLLGKGGMGWVCEALHEAIARRVAIKVLHSQFAGDPAYATRFFNEARAVNLIEHPSLVQVSDFGQLADGSGYLVMELLKGVSLAERLSRGQLPLVTVLQISWQIADALCAAHSKGVIHRDLKPANVMLVPEPVAPGGERVKLLDFGIAKLTQSDAEHTAGNVIMGTPMYMSPEQCRGASEVDARSDVYSLGVILYIMLAGRAPFQGTQGELIAQHLLAVPPPLPQSRLVPQVPPAAIALTECMLAKDRTKRPSMQAVRAEVARLLAASWNHALPLSAQTEYASQPEAGSRIFPISTLSVSACQVAAVRRRIPRVAKVFIGGCLFTGALLLSYVLPEKPRATSVTTINPQDPAKRTVPLVASLQPVKAIEQTDSRMNAAAGKNPDSTPSSSTVLVAPKRKKRAPKRVLTESSTQKPNGPPPIEVIAKQSPKANDDNPDFKLVAPRKQQTVLDRVD